MYNGFPVNSNQFFTEEDLWLEGWDVPASAGAAEKTIDINTTAQQVNVLDIGTGLNGAMAKYDGVIVTANMPVYIQVLHNTYPSSDATVMPRIPGIDPRLEISDKVPYKVEGKFKTMGQMQVRVNVLRRDSESSINYTGLRLTGILINLRRATMSPILATDKICYMVGDSVAGLYSVGVRAHRPYAFYPFIIRNGINDAYADEEGNMKRIRLVNRAIGSQTIFDFVKYIECDLATIPRCDIFIMSYGINEALANMDPALFRSYLEIVWKWFKREYRTSVMVVTGSNSLANNTNEARLSVLRGVMQEFVASINRPQLIYVSHHADIPNRLDLSYYNGNDGVHPGTPTVWANMGQTVLNGILNNEYCRRVLELKPITA